MTITNVHAKASHDWGVLRKCGALTITHRRLAHVKVTPTRRNAIGNVHPSGGIAREPTASLAESVKRPCWHCLACNAQRRCQPQRIYHQISGNTWDEKIRVIDHETTKLYTLKTNNERSHFSCKWARNRCRRTCALSHMPCIISTTQVALK